MEKGQKVFVIVDEVEWDEAIISNVNDDGTFNISHENGEYENVEDIYIAETKPESIHTDKEIMYDAICKIVRKHNKDNNMKLTFPEMHKIQLLIWRSPEILAFSAMIVDVISTVYSKRE